MQTVNLDRDTCSREENVSFIDQFPGPVMSVDTQADSTTKQGMHSGADLAGFLARPVKIFETNVAPAGVLNATIEPWHLWATNAAVKKKLDNFALFRGNLMLKVVINGTPFHYGKFIVSYKPLYNLDEVNETTISDASSTDFIQSMIAKSQRPNIKLDPSTNSGGCLCLPFLWTVNQLDISSAQEWIDLGLLSIDSMRALGVTSDTTSVITITIFAYCEDADISVPTYSPAAQAGDEYDPDRPVSTAASNVAAAAGILASIPVIKPFALAAELAANAVSGIASIFGFSKPNNIEPVMDMRRNPAGDMATTNSQDSVSKLTFDGKQGVTIDPRVTGVGYSDEMTIAYISGRETFLTYFDWETTDDVDTNLYWNGVTPVLTNTKDLGTSLQIQPTALAFAAIPFQYWSGTLVFRFEVQASRYHKGRLKIAWDPLSLANAQQADNLNINYVQVIDLEQTRNVEFSFPWGRMEPYLQTGDKATSYILDPIQGAGSSSGSIFNGFFNVSVMNRLVAPITSAGIRINVYVKAKEDFELHGPFDDNFQNSSYFPIAESGAEYSSPDAVAENDPKGASIVSDIAPGEMMNPIDLKSKVFFGERVASFRNLVKRYNLHGPCGITFDTPSPTSRNTVLVSYARPDFPEYGGYDPNALYETVLGANPFTPAYMTLLNYLAPAYVCQRGGMRNMYVTYCQYPGAEGSGYGAMVAFRQPTSLGANNVITQVLSVTASAGSTLNPVNSSFKHGGSYFQGSWVTQPTQQGVCKVETPFYTPSRFAPARYLNRLTGAGGKNNFLKRLYHEVSIVVPLFSKTSEGASTRAPATLNRWVAAADDFSLSFFLNAPRMFVYGTARPDVVPLT